MMTLQRARPNGDRHAGKGWHGFGHGDQAVRHTEAWEHETFAEEQARWERGDPDYARICDAVRQARRRGGEASRCAVEAKAEWDTRVATERQANDDAKRAHHALNVDRTARHRTASSRDVSFAATEEPSPKTLGRPTVDPRSRTSPRHAHHLRDGVQ
jgi:1,4-alpha-glucan branching enzyme